MKCPSGKRPYVSRQEAETALLDVRGRVSFREGSGPVNVYECDDCGEWHFTSKGAVAEFLQDQDIQEQLKKQQTANYWERRLRR